MRPLLLLGGLLVAAAALAQAPSAPSVANGLRGSAPLDAEPRAPLMGKPINDDRMKTRNYPTQPPIIPHHTDNYQVDLSFNKCLSCHARDKVAESQAPVVGVSHFQGRDGKVSSTISPRRYFCTQCHVPQQDVPVPVGNTFQGAAK